MFLVTFHDEPSSYCNTNRVFFFQVEDQARAYAASIAHAKYGIRIWKASGIGSVQRVPGKQITFQAVDNEMVMTYPVILQEPETIP